MRGFGAFLKKEYLEIVRTGRFVILLSIFCLFGIMAPAFAKLTPYLMELLSDSLSEVGLNVGQVTIDALTSWTQFFKNAPIVLIIFILVCSNILTKEYEQGTLIPVITKGLSRHKILAAKGTALMLLWTVCYTAMFLITYGYTVYFWDNSIAQNWGWAVLNYWIFGAFFVLVILFFSSGAKSNVAVLIGCGGVALFSTVLEFFPNIAVFLPTRLTNGMALLQGIMQPQDYIKAIIASAVVGLSSIVGAIVLFNRKKL